METITKIDMKEILMKLAKLQSDVEYIKQNMVDTDCILTEDDRKSIGNYEIEKREGNLISHEQLKKELAL